TDLYLARPLDPGPAVLIRSPYGRSRLVWGAFAGFFAERGYHAVIQSCRGTFGSGGQLDFHAEGADGRSAADWIVGQRWSNGEIGRKLDFTDLLGDHTVPTSFVGGWYDYFLPYLLEEHGRLAAAGRPVQLAVGPWAHANPQGLIAGLREALAWFEVHLKQGPGHAAPIRVNVMGAQPEWRELAAWPPGAAQVAWHLQPGRGLAPE